VRIPDDPQLSRQAGQIVALDAGLWIANLSWTHALYAESDGYRVRLPRLPGKEPADGWFIATGELLVGSAAMLRRGQGLRVRARSDWPGAPAGDSRPPPAEPMEITVQPLGLARDTKLFVVALVLCRPWLLDLGHTAPLPTTPEIARSILELTDAWHQLGLFDKDTAFRNRLTEQVGDHVK
jgi:hypothetical protein